MYPEDTTSATLLSPGDAHVWAPSPEEVAKREKVEAEYRAAEERERARHFRVTALHLASEIAKASDRYLSADQLVNDAKVLENFIQGEAANG